MEGQELLLISLGLLAAKILKQKWWWTRKWLAKREEAEGRGTLALLQNELRVDDRENFRNFLRMSEDKFLTVLNFVRANIEKCNTNMRQAISPEKRLAVTLRFLATGETFKSLSFATRIAHNTLSVLVAEVLHAIIATMKDTYLKPPMTEEDWISISYDFERLWGFPNCLGAIDGKHINFRPPRRLGSYYRNYKGTDSIVLLAIVNANYKFLCVDVGQNGRISDGGIFKRSAMWNAINNNKLSIPAERRLPNSGVIAPFIFVADDAFPLTKRIIKPYRYRGLNEKQRVYNHRLSRARRVVENAFGILSNRFRIFQQTINLDVKKVENIVVSCVILHNFLVDGNGGLDVEGECSRGPLQGIVQQGSNRAGEEAMAVRETFNCYFNSCWKLPWQEAYVRSNM